jgi:hypothetical protein
MKEYVTEVDVSKLTEPPSESTYVVVGVKNGNCYFGELDHPLEHLPQETIRLHNAQMMCGPVPFPDGVKGWFDLAVNGPNALCAVSPPVSYAMIGEIRDVLICTPLSAERWKRCPWPRQQQIVQAQSDPRFQFKAG